MNAPNHFVRIDLESAGSVSDRPDLICKAPADAMCHAVYTCDCEWWCKQGVEDGNPWHTPGDYSEPEDERHVGRFDPTECNLRDWAENSHECLSGEVLIPVEPEFGDEYYLFHAVSDGGA